MCRLAGAASRRCVFSGNPIAHPDCDDENACTLDETLPGFGVRVKPSGVRSYVVQFRNSQTGKLKRATIGKHVPLLTFDQAKRQARALLADAKRGDYVAEARRRARTAPTMRDLGRDCMERHAKPNKRPKSGKDNRLMIDRIILPAIGDRRVQEVTR